MLEIVLNNCKEWESNACTLLEEARWFFEFDDIVLGINCGLTSKVEALITKIQSTTRSGFSLGFDFYEIPKLQTICSTLQWCKKALSFCNLSPSLEDVLEATEDIPNTCVSGTLLNFLVDRVKWLRQALETISGPHMSGRCTLSEVEDIITDYQVVARASATVSLSKF